jgi:peptidoglycan/xylan/chitin deacetylase (PgdA/CDA1 family)
MVALRALRAAFALCAAVGLGACSVGGPGHPLRPVPGARSTAPPGWPPARLPGAARPGRPPRVVTNGPRTGDRVALTFDADMTDAMLYNLASGRARSYANVKVIDILQQRRVPATFFLTGEWVGRYPEVSARLAADPRFELGNHTYRHQGFTPHCYHLPAIAPNLMAADVAQTFRVIEPLGGRQTRYFRFPGGCYDQGALQELAPLGITVIGWDVVSGDAFATAWRPIVQAVLSRVRPGSIIVLHITEDNAPYTDEALPAILDGLTAKGLRPVTVSELLGADPAPGTGSDPDTDNPGGARTSPDAASGGLGGDAGGNWAG